MNKKVYYTDRSRIDKFQRCPQSRFLGYHWQGKGITIGKVNLDILVGICVHEGLGELLYHFIGNDGTRAESSLFVDKAVAIAHQRLAKELSNSPFDLSDYDTSKQETPLDLPTGLFLPDGGQSSISPDRFVEYLVAETKALVELLIRAYAYAPAGLKWLLDTYEVLEVEQEDHFTLYEGDEFDIEFMARADGLLRRRSDGALVVLSFKTTKAWDSRKESSAASDMQGMSEVVAIEERLKLWSAALDGLYGISKQENIPPPTIVQTEALTGIPAWFTKSQPTSVEGVQMIYLLTSEQRKDSDGWKKRSSGLLRPWTMNNMGELSYAFTAMWTDGMGKSRRLGKDWSRVNIWEEMSIAEYVDSIKDGFDDALGGNPLDSIIINSQLHRREKEKLERWKREVVGQEVRLYENLIQIEKWKASGESVAYSNGYAEMVENLHSITFPHHSSSCAYPTRCIFYPICWESRFYRDDPLASGFRPRIPHHEIEAKTMEDV